MRQTLNTRMLIMCATWLVVLGARIFITGAAQAQNSEPKMSASSLTEPTQEAKKAAAKGGTEASEEKPIRAKGDIQVHGHWVIEVRDPDGTLVTRREFENSYIGGNMLANFTARRASVGLWAITLEGNAETYAITEPSETRNVPAGTVQSRNLAVSAPSGFALSGSFTAPVADTISFVFSWQALCSADVAPATPCTNGTYSAFTQTGPPPTTSFAQGQIVQVTVTITFS